MKPHLMRPYSVKPHLMGPHLIGQLFTTSRGGLFAAIGKNSGQRRERGPDDNTDYRDERFGELFADVCCLKYVEPQGCRGLWRGHKRHKKLSRHMTRKNSKRVQKQGLQLKGSQNEYSVGYRSNDPALGVLRPVPSRAFLHRQKKRILVSKQNGLQNPLQSPNKNRGLSQKGNCIPAGTLILIFGKVSPHHTISTQILKFRQCYRISRCMFLLQKAGGSCQNLEEAHYNYNCKYSGNNTDKKVQLDCRFGKARSHSSFLARFLFLSWVKLQRSCSNTRVSLLLLTAVYLDSESDSMRYNTRRYNTRYNTRCNTRC